MRYIKYISIGSISLLLCLFIGLYTYADQIIYVEVSDFDRSLSQFGVEVKGNTWVETLEDGAIDGTAFGGPGDNNHSADLGEPYLIIKLPSPVNAGESTADGKTWAVWGRLYVPVSATTDFNSFNSFLLRMSADAQNWTPGNRGDTTLRWNDAGGQFPGVINNIDVLFTDVGDRLPWYWEKHSANSQSTIDPTLAVGDNYIEIGIRESDATNYPRIDVICFRNDDKQPSDSEVPMYITAVKPKDKLAVSWGEIKSTH